MWSPLPVSRRGAWLLYVTLPLLAAPLCSATDLELLVRPAVHGSLLESLAGALPAANASLQCAQDAAGTLAAALQGELWALRIVDASARLPSGLLSGNVNQLGDFDQCLSPGGVLGEFKDDWAQDGVAPQYCLAALELRLPSRLSEDARIRIITQLLHSYSPFRSNLSDVGHRVPHTSSVQLGLCAPASCGSQELQGALERVFADLHLPQGASIGVSVTRELCRRRDHAPPEDSIGAGLARLAFVLVLVMVAVGTLFDLVALEEEGPPELRRVLLAFSLRQNWRRLVDTRPQSGGDVPCLHGVRGLSALGLLVTHKSVAMQYNPYVNRTAFFGLLGLAWSIIGRAAILYTDCFILLSGVLTARALLRRLQRTGRVDFVSRAVDRYVRLTPTFAGLMVFCTLVLPNLGSGPLWGMVVEPHATLCRQYWWRNLLYVHNYFGFETMCLTHTHQLGIDMQLFLVAPLLVYPLWRWPRAGLLLLSLVAAGSTLLRYHVTLEHQLSTLVFFGVSISQMFKTANLSYILPTHRATVYVMGIALGYALHRLPRDFTISRRMATLGWLVLTTVGVLSVFGPYRAGTVGFQYNVKEAALYAAVSPITWSSFVSWAIFACTYNAGGWFGDLLSWRGWQIFTRIAYTLYLTQFPVFFYNVGSTRHADFYTIRHLLNMSEFALVFAVSTVLTLTFEMPFQELRRVQDKEKSLETNASGFDKTIPKVAVKLNNKSTTMEKRKSA